MNLIDVKVNLVLFNHKMQGVMLTLQNKKYYLLSDNFQRWCEVYSVTPIRKFNHE